MGHFEVIRISAEASFEVTQTNISSELLDRAAFDEYIGERSAAEHEGSKMTGLEKRLIQPPNEDILYEHLGYALDLVALALREIGEPPRDDEKSEYFRGMAIIEVFWSQMRLLIEFFNGGLGRTTTTTAADFTKTELRYSFDFGDKNIDDMMNNQIAHMNNARTADPDRKLRSDDMYRVARALAREVGRFEKELTDKYKETWDIRVAGREPIDPSTIYTSRAAPQACTVQTSTSSMVGFGFTGPTNPTGTYIGGPTGPSGPSR